MDHDQRPRFMVALTWTRDDGQLRTQQFAGRAANPDEALGRCVTDGHAKLPKGLSGVPESSWKLAGWTVADLETVFAKQESVEMPEDSVELPDTDPERPWQAVAQVWPPYGLTLETCRLGEVGTNRCCAVFAPEDIVSRDPGSIEWVEEGTGVTTVTHGTFLSPTHWRLPKGT
jgi:hypothetical protein